MPLQLCPAHLCSPSVCVDPTNSTILSPLRTLSASPLRAPDSRSQLYHSCVFFSHNFLSILLSDDNVPSGATCNQCPSQTPQLRAALSFFTCMPLYCFVAPVTAASPPLFAFPATHTRLPPSSPFIHAARTLCFPFLSLAPPSSLPFPSPSSSSPFYFIHTVTFPFL